MNITKKETKTKGIVLLLLSALSYSAMPVLIRFLGGGGIPPMSQVFLRYIFAFIAASVYLFGFTKTRIKIKMKDVPLLLFVTVFTYSLTNLFFTYGILYTEVSNALFLFYSYAIMTPIIGYVILKEKLNRYNIITLFISLLALFLLYQPNALPTWKLGGLFALLSALGQSLYVVLRRLLKEYPAAVMIFLNTFVGVVVLGTMSLYWENGFYTGGEFGEMSINSWIVTVLFGVLNFLGWLFMTKGFELFNATAGSLILLTELVFGIVFALVFFGEVPTLLTLFGGGLILASSVMVILKGNS